MVISFSILSISILNVSILTSTKIGLRLFCIIGHSDVDQQIAGIITSLPGGTFFIFKGFVNAERANKFDDDPELVIKAYFAPIFFAKYFSKFLVILEIVIFFDFKTLMPSLISFLLKASDRRLYLNFFIIHIFNYLFIINIFKIYKYYSFIKIIIFNFPS